MSLSPPLVIRIVPDEGEAVDWSVHQNIVFRDVLVCVYSKSMITKPECYILILVFKNTSA